MEGKRLFSILVLCMLGVAVCGQAFAARTIKGTVLSSAADRVFVREEGGASMAIRALPKATVTRGQLGKDVRKAKVSDFAAGDRIVAVVNQDGSASSLKALYAIAKGTLASSANGKVFFQDGRSVKLHSGVPVVFADGKIGKSADLKPGQQLICRVNPTSGEAWTVVATHSAPSPKVVPKPTEVAVAPVAPEVKPVIESISFKGPSDPKPKDWIRVDLLGTPGGRAVCEIKGLIPRTVMTEVSPGEYRASVMVPSGKIVHKEALLGHLTIAGVDAPTLQAGKLFTVDPSMVASAVLPVTPPVPVPEPEPAVEPAPVPAPPAPEPAPVVEAPKPEPPKAKAPVVVTAPALGAKIQSALTISGTAEPGANVVVVVSYSNGISGLLNLSGQVSSQLVAAGPTGEFKMGPIALEGPLATKGLILTVNAYYPEDAGKTAACVSAYGDRG